MQHDVYGVPAVISVDRNPTTGEVTVRFTVLNDGTVHEPTAAKPKDCGCGGGSTKRNRPGMIRSAKHAALLERSDRIRKCAGCELAQRWLGLWWCGTPKPRKWRRENSDGCGCCMNMKWHVPGARCPLEKW